MDAQLDIGSDGCDRVAVIGMAGRFPGAADLEAFWRNLSDGTEGISTLQADELRAAGVSAVTQADAGYVPRKGVLAGADQFDASFFGISPREAEIMDPQHRVFLECAWEALESAGHDPLAFDGRIAIFGGSSLNTYLLENIAKRRDVMASAGRYQTLIASDKDFLVTRTAYKLDLRGAAITVQSACSTSLAAIHLAAQSLLNGECDLALAGGVCVTVPLAGGYQYEAGGILSADGHCRAFDAQAGGTVTGNGVGLVVLRRLDQALADGDLIEAVILGSAMNNDGSRKVGYTAPSVDGQAEVIAEAMAIAGAGPDSIGYVETHGTGTVLGDPIEIAALTRAYGASAHSAGDSAGAWCAIGSVKSSVGHLDAAAGVTSFIKATLALSREAIPATLHVTEPNPALALDTSPFFVNTALRPWPRTGVPRRAGVSAFGIGGTNVHVVLEEAPARLPAGPPTPRAGTGRPAEPFVLSGKTAAAATAAAERLATFLQENPGIDRADVAFTLATRRRAFDHRVAAAVPAGADGPKVLRRAGRTPRAVGREPVRPVFLFPGQGAQYVDMTRGLVEHEPVFAEHAQRCADLFRPYLGADLLGLMLPDDAHRAGAVEWLAQTANTQAAVFLAEYALAATLRDWGVEPAAMLGHSLGEYTAACLAGVFSLEDAVVLVAARGALMQSMEPGSMLAVGLGAADVTPLLDAELALAAVNSPSATVISGPVERIRDLADTLAQAGVETVVLATSHAFHSPMMQPAAEALVAAFRGVTLSPPRIPFMSNVTGTWITDEQATSPEYWGRHLLSTVQFDDAARTLVADRSFAFVEVGPGHALTNLLRRRPEWETGRVSVTCTRRDTDPRTDHEALLCVVGELWSAGAVIDWATCLSADDRCQVRVPPYPFQRERYWLAPDPIAVAGLSPSPQAQAGPSPQAPIDAAPAGPAYGIGWRSLNPADAPPAAPPSALTGPRVWLVLGQDTDLVREVAGELSVAGGAVVRVVQGDALSVSPDLLSWTLEPTDPEHYRSMLGSLAAGGLRPTRIVHLWTAERGPVDLDADSLDEALALGYESVRALGVALAAIGDENAVGVDVLSRGVFQVTGVDELQPEHAVVAAACTVLPQEIAGVSCRLVDLDAASSTGPTSVSRLCHLLATRDAPPQVAWRGTRWWVPTYDPIPLDDARPGALTLRPGGVYLITGGLGGVGLALAERLSGAVTAPVLALLTHSTFPGPQLWDDLLDSRPDDDATAVRIRRLQAIEASGARVVVLRGDVTSPAELAVVLGLLRAEWGPIDGVIHAAGLASRGLLSTSTAADGRAVMAPKTRGTMVLDALCRQDDLDFVLLCSSVTSVLGGPGQADYCAANQFLNAYAELRSARSRTRWTAIAWDTWQGVGMAAATALPRRGTGPTISQLQPMIDERFERGSGAFVARTRFSTAETWIVNEHRIMGHGLVPGTAYLELVREAVADRAAGRELGLTDVLFSSPLVVPDGQVREVYTSVEPAGTALRFRIQSRDPGSPAGTWRQHATGTATFFERAERSARDLAGAFERVSGGMVLSSEDELRKALRLDLAEQGGAIQFVLGPRWRCLTTVRSGANLLIATLTQPAEFLGDLDSYWLHPALMDVAGAAARLRGDEGYYLPFGYDHVRVVRPMSATMHCLVVPRGPDGGSTETITCDIDIVDDTGNLLVEVVGLTLKRVNDVDVLLAEIATAATADNPRVDAPGASTPMSRLEALQAGMSVADCLTTFDRILADETLPSVVVVSGSALIPRLASARAVALDDLTAELDQLPPQHESHARPLPIETYVAPRTETERGIAAIWQDVLGIAEVGIEDDFFSLGGHSLAAVQIGSRLRARFGVDLTLRDFFAEPTIVHTVELLAEAEKSPTAAVGAIPYRARTASTQAPVDVVELTDDEVDAMLRTIGPELADPPAPPRHLPSGTAAERGTVR